MKTKFLAPLFFCYTMLGLPFSVFLYFIISNPAEINWYSSLLLGLLLICAPWSLGTMKVTDLDIPLKEKINWFTGEYFNLSRLDFKNALHAFITKYARQEVDRALIKSFVFYAGIFYAGIMIGFIFSTSVLISALLYRLQDFFFLSELATLILNVALIGVVVYCGFFLYQFKFDSSSFPNTWLTLKNINRNDLLLEFNQKKSLSSSASKPDLIKRAKQWNFEAILIPAYREYVNEIVKELKGLGYDKYWWRLCYNEMVHLGLARNKAQGLNILDAANCFASSFDEINIATFQDNRSQSDYSDRRAVIQSDIIMILKSIPAFPRNEIRKIEEEAAIKKAV